MKLLGHVGLFAATAATVLGSYTLSLRVAAERRGVERVERSIASTRHYRLPSGGGVRVVGRRVPGRDGVVWQQVFDPGVDRDDPAVRTAAAEMVQQSRSFFGQ